MAELIKEDFIAKIQDFNKNIDFNRSIKTPCEKVLDIDMHNVLSSTLIEAIKQLPNTPPEEEDKPELRTFFNNYFKSVWVNYAYARFLRTHGKNITQFGAQYITDQDAQNIAAEDLALMIKGFEADGRVYLVKATNYLHKVEHKLDSIDYSINENDTPIKPKRNFRLLGA